MLQGVRLCLPPLKTDTFTLYVYHNSNKIATQIKPKGNVASRIYNFGRDLTGTARAVLRKGASGGLPRRAQKLLLRLGQLFKGGFPAQGGTAVGAALQIGKALGPVGAGVARAPAAAVGPQAGGGVVGFSIRALNNSSRSRLLSTPSSLGNNTDAP